MKQVNLNIYLLKQQKKLIKMQKKFLTSVPYNYRVKCSWLRPRAFSKAALNYKQKQNLNLPCLAEISCKSKEIN